MDSCDESKYIFDDYQHPDSRLFYTITRIIGNDVFENGCDYFESGCSCENSQCTNENNCACLRYGINYRWSDDKEKGGVDLILEDEKFGNVPVFECNSNCSCFERVKNVTASNKIELIRIPGMCRNRNVQFGPLDHLEIFDAEGKGLGLRAGQRISRGSFICEYAGEVIDLEEAKKRQSKLMTSGEMNFVFVLREHVENNLLSVTCVDPSLVGNIGRYINHSCQPNSAIVPVRVNNTIPWLCVFAIRDIESGEEICYDYSGQNSSESYEGDHDRKPCLCGSIKCKKFLPYQMKL